MQFILRIHVSFLHYAYVSKISFSTCSVEWTGGWPCKLFNQDIRIFVICFSKSEKVKSITAWHWNRSIGEALNRFYDLVLHLFHDIAKTSLARLHFSMGLDVSVYHCRSFGNWQTKVRFRNQDSDGLPVKEYGFRIVTRIQVWVFSVVLREKSICVQYVHREIGCFVIDTNLSPT